MSYRSSVPSRGDGFASLLRAEWTKLRSVRSTRNCVLLVVGLTVFLSVLASAVGGTDANEGPHFTDQFSFVHRSLTGDGTLTARVASQQDTDPWAKAGIIVKAGTGSGATYAAMLLTPGHGVRMESAFTTSTPGPGGSATAPVWLRLTRTGDMVTGSTSTDGTNFRPVGTVRLSTLPPIVQIGFAVSSPPKSHQERIGHGTRTVFEPVVGTATFDSVTVQGSTGPTWSHDDVGLLTPQPGGGATAAAGGFTQAGGAFTVTGSGDIAGYGIPSYGAGGDDDVVINSLVGVQVGLLVAIALGVIFGAAEYKTGTVRTTFTASPRRGRVLAARALVLSAAVFAAGLVASVGAFLAAQPGLRRNGFAPPAYPYRSLTEPPVLRAVLGTALVLAVLAVLGLAIGVLLRRSVRALILVLGVLLVPQIVGDAVLSVDAQKWVDRLTPVAGLAVQQTRPRFDTAIGPWGGFAVLCAYAAVALVTAIWSVRRRDA